MRIYDAKTAKAIEQFVKEQDFVHVVRCRACIHWSDGGIDEAGRKLYPYCHLNDNQRKSNDYCSYGERKGGDE